MSGITDRELVELLANTTRGKWVVGSDESFKFHIYAEGTSPVKYVLSEIPENVNNYDVRLMALAKVLAEEVFNTRRNRRAVNEVNEVQE